MKFDFNIKKHIACIVAILAAVLALFTYLSIDGPQDTGKAAIVSACIFVAMLLSIVNITVEIHDKEGGALSAPFFQNSVAGPDHLQSTHRQNLELALIRPMFERYGGDVGKRVKKLVDEMLAQDVPTMPAPVEDSKAAMSAVPRDPIPAATGGPRVTKEDIEAEIVSEHYFVGSDAIQHPNAVHVFGDAGWYLGATQRMTFCVLQLKNGFTVTGESACVSPENFDAQIGRDIARANAIEKMWLLLGFRLADKLAAR